MVEQRKIRRISNAEIKETFTAIESVNDIPLTQKGISTFLVQKVQKNPDILGAETARNSD